MRFFRILAFYILFILPFSSLLAQDVKLVNNGNAWQDEKIPASLPGLDKEDKSQITFSAPKEHSAYRFFVYTNDGKGHFSTAIIQFYVK